MESKERFGGMSKNSRAGHPLQNFVINPEGKAKATKIVEDPDMEARKKIERLKDEREIRELEQGLRH